MPIYEYKCQKCGGIYEVKQSFADEPLTTHEGCGGTVERLISAPALQFKGTGWYVTDYARAKGGGSGNGKSGSDSKSESKSDSKSESKSDSKSESKSDSSSSSKRSESKNSSSSSDKK